jgi:chromosome segregation ATPase
VAELEKHVHELEVQVRDGERAQLELKKRARELERELDVVSEERDRALDDRLRVDRRAVLRATSDARRDLESERDAHEALYELLAKQQARTNAIARRHERDLHALRMELEAKIVDLTTALANREARIERLERTREAAIKRGVKFGVRGVPSRADLLRVTRAQLGRAAGRGAPAAPCARGK